MWTPRTDFVDTVMALDVNESYGATLQNRSGAQRVATDVVIQDTANDLAFTTTNVEANPLIIGVVAQTTAALAQGLVQDRGVCTLRVDAATARGDWLVTSTTPTMATPKAIFQTGVFALALETIGGAGTIDALLMVGAFPGDDTFLDGVLTMGGNVDLDGNDLILDTDGDSYLHEAADDVIDLVLAGAGGEFAININGAEDFRFIANDFQVLAGSSVTLIGAGSIVDLNGIDGGLVIDADGDTYIDSFGADDHIRIVIGGNSDFYFSADQFTVSTGSHILMTDESWIGLTAPGGRLIFEISTTPDQIQVDDAHLCMLDGHELRLYDPGNSHSIAHKAPALVANSVLTWPAAIVADKYLKVAAGGALSWADVGGGVDSGLIVLWHGTIANIPAGYVICDGNNSTPNLLTKFVQGVATAATNPGAIGGAATHTLTIAELAAHTHYYSRYQYASASASIYGVPRVTTDLGTQNTSSTGADSAHNNEPAYYDVAFLMKT